MDNCLEIKEEVYKGRQLLRRGKRRDLVLKGLKFKIVSIPGLEFMVKPGKQIGVETSYIESVIRIASVLMNRDYLKESKHNMETLGISKYSIDEQKNLVV